MSQGGRLKLLNFTGTKNTGYGGEFGEEVVYYSRFASL